MQAFSDSTKRVSRSIWRWIMHYIYGMFSKSFNSAIIAMDAVIGLAVGAAASADVAKPNWKVAVSVFGVTFLRSCLMYFRDNPLPERLPETQPPFPVAIESAKIT